MTKTVTLHSVETELLPIAEYDSTSDFVAISCEVNEDGFCYHSGLIIHLDKQLKYFHFTGKEVDLIEITDTIENYDSLYCKRLNVVNEFEVATFLGHCETLKQKGVKPLYGFVFNNSYYDSNTYESFLINCEHDITTCVGFCIKVIRGFLYNHDEYISINDWSTESLEGAPEHLLRHMKLYLQKYAQEKGLDHNDLYAQDELKRILPSELTSSGFFDNLPVSKVLIDTVNPLVENFFQTAKKTA